MKIHHATLKKAADLGFAMQSTQDEAFVEVTHDTILLGLDADPKVALQQAIDNKKNGTPFEESTSTKIMADKYRAKYAPHNDSCGDDMSNAITNAVEGDDGKMDIGRLQALAAENEIDVKKYDHLNNGQMRMNVGNRLRGRLKQGNDVTFNGKVVFKAEDLAI